MTTTETVGEHPRGFDDLVAANKRYSISFPHGFDGIAHQGVLILTCMDSRLEPLEMFGLRVGEAKILRTAGGRLTHPALAAMVMGVHKLKVNRILIVPHTLCAAASVTEEELRDTITDLSGVDAHDFSFGVDPDQMGRLREDVETVRSNPLVGPFAEVGGFLYNVETGLVEQIL
ncbi:MAG TPA: carbonic anhydrase [Propioniciclava sp.]|jgi:carbonic anhydrase|uniref:beta-class carbonic anhydrase n=1 Tax=Propioniciclava sp. TaxID=2038686 RepID=UPI002BDFA564|nr:carbonic anhydrase [Propioniciclava sp.]HRL48134.1 carbonic anhydrase [Propioniciclava sp.]HRL79447.1 carbonic anhydrase [Propioniciclava sp.]